MADKLIQIVQMIEEMDGQCIFGCPELSNASDEERNAYRMGSAHAFARIAEQAKEILDAE